MLPPRCLVILSPALRRPIAVARHCSRPGCAACFGARRYVRSPAHAVPLAATASGRTSVLSGGRLIAGDERSSRRQNKPADKCRQMRRLARSCTPSYVAAGRCMSGGCGPERRGLPLNRSPARSAGASGGFGSSAQLRRATSLPPTRRPKAHSYQERATRGCIEATSFLLQEIRRSSCKKSVVPPARNPSPRRTRRYIAVPRPPAVTPDMPRGPHPRMRRK
jgi:hypothetical protein